MWLNLRCKLAQIGWTGFAYGVVLSRTWHLSNAVDLVLDDRTFATLLCSWTALCPSSWSVRGTFHADASCTCDLGKVTQVIELSYHRIIISFFKIWIDRGNFHKYGVYRVWDLGCTHRACTVLHGTVSLMQQLLQYAIQRCWQRKTWGLFVRITGKIRYLYHFG